MIEFSKVNAIPPVSFQLKTKEETLQTAERLKQMEIGEVLMVSSEGLDKKQASKNMGHLKTAAKYLKERRFLFAMRQGNVYVKRIA